MIFLTNTLLHFCFADLVYSLVQEHEDLSKVGPFLDPVNAAARNHYGVFARWFSQDINLFKPDFGLKVAVMFYVGRQDSSYEPDEFVQDEDAREVKMLEWLGENGRTDYTRRQKLWMVETDAFAKLVILETFMANARRQEKLASVSQFGNILSGVFARNWERLNDVWGATQRIPEWVIRQSTVQTGVKYIMESLIEESEVQRPALSSSSSPSSTSTTTSTSTASAAKCSQQAEWGSSNSLSEAGWGSSSSAASTMADWGSTTTTSKKDTAAAAAAATSKKDAAPSKKDTAAAAAAATSKKDAAPSKKDSAAAAAPSKLLTSNTNKKGKIIKQYEVKDFLKANGTLDCPRAIRCMLNLREDQLQKLIAVRQKLAVEGKLDCRRHLAEYDICKDCGQPTHFEKTDCKYPLAKAAYLKNEKVIGLGLTLPCLRCDGFFDHVVDVCPGVHQINCPKCHRPGHFKEECNIFNDDFQRMMYFLKFMCSGALTRINEGGVLGGKFGWGQMDDYHHFVEPLLMKRIIDSKERSIDMFRETTPLEKKVYTSDDDFV